MACTGFPAILTLMFAIKCAGQPADVVKSILMQLTKSSDYSLRVLIYLAQRPGVRTTIRRISEAHDISENHVMEVVQKLAKRGYVKTTRAKGAGICLASST